MKDIIPQNYISIDLEINTNINDDTTKIIQVGTSIGNFYDGILETHSWFVDPLEPLSQFVIELTGITPEIIKNQSISLHKISENLQKLIINYDTFSKPVEWGFADSALLKKEFEENNIQFPFLGRNNIDVKQVYTFIETVNGRSPKGGLSTAMAKYHLKFEGKKHRADDDAKNTLRFYFELMKRQRVFEETLQNLKKVKF